MKEFKAGNRVKVFGRGETIWVLKFIEDVNVNTIWWWVEPDDDKRNGTLCREESMTKIKKKGGGW